MISIVTGTLEAVVSGSHIEDKMNQRQEAHEDFLEEVPLELALKDEWNFTKYQDRRNTQ